MSILVCGGSEYIASHTISKLVEDGKSVVVVDNLQTNYIASKDKLLKFYKGDIRDSYLLDEIFTENQIDCTLHFASNCSPYNNSEKSIINFNNVYGTQILLENMAKHNVKNIIFSSPVPIFNKVSRVEPLKMSNDCCEPNQTIEDMIKWCNKAYGINFVILKYLDIFSALKCKSNCDYIHVVDLANAHVKAIAYLKKEKESAIFKLSNQMCFNENKINITAKNNIYSIFSKKFSKAAGDLISSSGKGKKILDWTPEYTDIKDIIKDALAWAEDHPIHI